jgi:hypothetical protein
MANTQIEKRDIKNTSPDFWQDIKVVKLNLRLLPKIISWTHEGLS